MLTPTFLTLWRNRVGPTWIPRYTELVNNTGSRIGGGANPGNGSGSGGGGGDDGGRGGGRGAGGGAGGAGGTSGTGGTGGGAGGGGGGGQDPGNDENDYYWDFGTTLFQKFQLYIHIPRYRMIFYW